MPTQTMTAFALTDGVDYPLADYFNRLFAGSLRAQFANTETITGTKQLTDGDCPIQLITASGANRDVELPVKATTNHWHMIVNAGGSNNVVVKDDTGATTYATLPPGASAIFVPTGTTWEATVGVNTSDTLTNKRITKRVVSVASSTSPAINTDICDIYRITALAGNISSMSFNLTGTPTHGQALIVEITDNGVARTIAYGSSFASTTKAVLPAATTAGKMLRLGFMWDSVDSTWDLVAVTEET